MATTSNKAPKAKMSNSPYGIGSDSNQRFRGDVDDQNLETAINADPEAFGGAENNNRSKKNSKENSGRGNKSIVNKIYEKDDTGEKTAAEGENDEGFAVHENIQTGEDMNSPGRNGFNP